MKISVRIKPNARKNAVKPTGDNEYDVSVTAPPIDGKANDKLIEVLAKYFDKPKRSVRILRGVASKQKLVEIT